jgi:hypothetical protein
MSSHQPRLDCAVKDEFTGAVEEDKAQPLMCLSIDLTQSDGLFKVDQQPLQRFSTQLHDQPPGLSVLHIKSARAEPISETGFRASSRGGEVEA